MLLQAFSVSACRPQLPLRGPFELDAVHRSQRRDGDLHSAHGLVHPRRTSLGRRRFSSAAPQLRRRPAPALQRQDNTLGHWLSITSGSPWVLLLGQLCLPRHRRLRHFGRPRRFGGRRGVRFRRSLGIALKGSLPPSLLFVHLPPSSRSSRNVRESKFTVRRTSRTPPSLPPPSSIPNLFIYHSKKSPVDCTHSHLTRGTPAGGPPAPGPGRALALARPHPL